MLSDPAIAFDLALLESTADTVTRNAIALRMSEARVPDLDQVLVRLIRRPELAKCRGTLVHALRKYDCSRHFGLLVDLVISGGFEVAHEAFEAIDMIGMAAGDEVDTAFEKLERAAIDSQLEDWRKSLLIALLAMMD